MIAWTLAPLLMALAASPAAPGAHQPIYFAQMSVQQQIIVRVAPRMREVAPAGASLIEWTEGRGPKCVPAKSIVGATLLGQNSVDLILLDNSRIRARLERSCPALDYYYGFYIRPHTDGRVCADRDQIRSRMGGACGIDQFRSLRPTSRD